MQGGGGCCWSTRPTCGLPSSAGDCRKHCLAVRGYFSPRLRGIYFAITTLIFSQIFYVSSSPGPRLAKTASTQPPGFVDPWDLLDSFTTETLFALGSDRILSRPAAHHPVAVWHGATVDSRERRPHAGDRLSGRALQDCRGHAIGAVRGTCRRALCDPESICRARFCLLRNFRRRCDLQCHGRHRHAGRTDPRRGVFCCAKCFHASSPNTISFPSALFSLPWSFSCPKDCSGS